MATLLLALLLGCSFSQEAKDATVSPGGGPPPSGAPALDDAHPDGAAVSEKDWLERAVREVRNADPITFTAHLYDIGYEIQVSTGEAGPAGYRVTVKNGADAAADAPVRVTYYQANHEQLRRRADFEGETGQWETVNHQLAWGLGALTPHRTDAITILEGLSTPSSTVVNGSSFTCQADLAIVFRVLTGTTIRDPHGKSAFPAGSTVSVEIVPGTSRIRHLRLDGDAVIQSLRDLHLDSSGLVDGAMHAFDVDIDYPEDAPQP
jgi:hypothetical protein